MAPAALSGVTAAATPTAITLSAAASPCGRHPGLQRVPRHDRQRPTPVKVNSDAAGPGEVRRRGAGAGRHHVLPDDRGRPVGQRVQAVDQGRGGSSGHRPDQRRRSAQTVGAVKWAACTSARACGNTTIIGGARPHRTPTGSPVLPAGTNTSLYRSEWYGGSRCEGRAPGRSPCRYRWSRAPTGYGCTSSSSPTVKPGARRFDVRLEGRTVLVQPGHRADRPVASTGPWSGSSAPR